MNRLLVLLVASLLGTGCVVHDTCDARTVSLGWSSFRLANNDVVSTCAGAGVNAVDVFMDNQSVGSFNCTDGGVNVTGVLNDGNHVFDVEGIDSVSGAVALRDSFTIGNSNCSNPVVDTQPSEGTFDLSYSFTPNNVCNGTSYIWFSIHDDISGDVIAVDDAHGNPKQYQCGGLVTFALASGGYTLQRTEEVTFSGTTPQPSASNCNSAAFTMSGGQQTQVVVSMADTATFCP